MWYGLKMVALTKRQDSVAVAELKMLRFSLMRMNRIKNDPGRGTAQIGHFGDQVTESKLR